MKSETPKRGNHSVRADFMKEKEPSLVMANIWSEVSDLVVLVVLMKAAKPIEPKALIL